MIPLFLISMAGFSTTYYLAPTGSDASGNGSIGSPWFSLNKAWSVVVAGDLVYMRGGTYIYSTQQTMSNKSGTSGNLIKIWAYPGEIPKIMHTTPSGWFILMENSNYIHFKGLEISGENRAAGTGLNWEMYGCNYCIIEQINYHNLVQGLFIRGNSSTGLGGYGNTFLNCDFHHNQDPNSSPAYEHADGCGFNWNATQTGVAPNVMKGCRIYWNCDDGLDMWQDDLPLIIDNCWSFYNGYIPGTFNSVGTGGNGFKLGVSQDDHGNTPLITVKNCIAYKNKMDGFNQNGTKSAVAFYNNIAYLNGRKDYWLGDDNTHSHILTNNISYKNASAATISSASILTTNTILLNGSVNSAFSVSDNDFQSLSDNQLLNPRKADGSLPDVTFLKLASTSALIDKGTDVGIAYSGAKPDLGPFESNSSSTPLPSVPVYSASSVENATPSILGLTYNLSLASIVPAASAFKVMVNSAVRTVNSVSVSGNTVSLTLASAAVYGDIITVAYTAPASNPLQATSGGLAASISAQTVKNNVSQVALPAYVSSVIQDATPKNLEMTYSLSLANIVPAASAFKVLVNSVAATINSASISGTKITLVLANQVANGDIITVAYTKPTTNPVQTASGLQAATISAQPVTNNILSISKDAAPVTITMTISPNRLHHIINAQFVYSSSFSAQNAAMSPQVLRTFDINGKLVLENKLVIGVTSTRLSINLYRGIYNVMLFSGTTKMATSKIVVY